MKRWLGPFAALLAAAFGFHALTLYLAPGLIMGRALEALAQRGVALHSFTTTERVTPQAQSIVRSSPDLYYALCRYDLDTATAGLEVRMGGWPAYQSLSFFDARTDNFATRRGTRQRVVLRLLPPGSAPQDGAIISPSAKGVILIRRLAPSAEAFAKAAQAGKGDACMALPLAAANG